MIPHWPELEKFGKLVKTLTQRSNHRRFRHASLVLKGGAILASGYNLDHKHAEVQALSKLWPNKRKGTTVWSIRLSKSGKLSNAKPCPACQKFLEDNGVKTVYYSTPSGDVERMRIRPDTAL